MLTLRPEQPEQRRTEQHSGQHFRDHLRLSEPKRNGAHQPAEQEDDGELKEKLNGEMNVIHGAAM
jgi:hypothetical protein